MKAEDKGPLQRVRIAVLGNVNVGKSGKFLHIFAYKLMAIHLKKKKNDFTITLKFFYPIFINKIVFHFLSPVIS